VERRHHDPAGTVVVVAVDRQQAVAEQRDQLAEVALAPVEVLCVRDEHVVVRLGAEHEHEALVEEPHAEHRPVLLVAPEQQRERVVQEAGRATHAEARRARRE
jgi:hypothetical protein